MSPRHSNGVGRGRQGGELSCDAVAFEGHPFTTEDTEGSEEYFLSSSPMSSPSVRQQQVPPLRMSRPEGEACSGRDDKGWICSG